jgi:RNA polymerase sigma-70 factor (ECF subfamily)
MHERSGMEERIHRAKRGDRTALGELVAEHYPRVYRFCARRLGDDLGQDAAQETFVTMQRTISRYEGRSCFETWLLGVAHNHCRNLARKRMRDPLALDDTFEAPSADHSAQCADGEALRSALEKLSPEHREVVLLHEVEGLSYAEVAEVAGVPEGTVKSRLYHAFRNLREILSEVPA